MILINISFKRKCHVIIIIVIDTSEQVYDILIHPLLSFQLFFLAILFKSTYSDLKVISSTFNLERLLRNAVLAN